MTERHFTLANELAADIRRHRNEANTLHEPPGEAHAALVVSY